MNVANCLQDWLKNMIITRTAENLSIIIYAHAYVFIYIHIIYLCMFIFLLIDIHLSAFGDWSTGNLHLILLVIYSHIMEE